MNNRLLSEEELEPIYNKCVGDKYINGFAYEVTKAQDSKTRQENDSAISDYANEKISFEKLAERLGVNYYDLYMAFVIHEGLEVDVRSKTLKAVGDYLDKKWESAAEIVLTRELIKTLLSGNLPGDEIQEAKK